MEPYSRTKAFTLLLWLFLCFSHRAVGETTQNSKSETDINFPFRFQLDPIDRNNKLLEYFSKTRIRSSTDAPNNNLDTRPILLENVIPFYLKDWLASGKLEQFAQKEGGLFTGVSKDCTLASRQWIKDVTLGLLNGSTPTWAFQMIDAWGKFPEGVLSGHLGATGDFHECLQIRGNYTTDDEAQERFFKGSYCFSYVIPNVGSERFGESKATFGNPNSRQSVSPGEILQNVMDLNSPMLMLPSLGMCFPSTCSQNDSQTILSNAHALAGNIVSQPVTACYTDEKPDFDAADISMIAVLSIIGGLCVLGTLVDVLFYTKNAKASMSKRKEMAYKLLVAFSLYTNILKWSSVSVGKDNLGCLHGLRFFSMCWVVLCHTLTMYIAVPNNWNVIDMRNMYKSNWSIYALLNGTLSVDTFLTMSGALVAYNLLKALDKEKGRVNIPLMYFHRFIRLTPTYIIIIGMMSTILPYISSGPMWYLIEAESAACAKNWWHNILYISNLFKYTANNQGCYGEAWYLANDMQFFWLSPLLIYPLWRWKKFGFGLLILLSVASMVTPAVIAHDKKLLPTVSPFSKLGTFLDDLYQKPWTRIGPYLVGIVLGYILHSLSTCPKYKRRLPKIVILAAWLISTLTALAIIFGPYSYFDPTNREAATTSVGSAVYAGMHRYIWGVVIAWIIFACVEGYGGWINNFLSWAPFVPLGRLTFCVYITSYQLQKIYHITVTTPTYYSLYITTNIFFAHLVMSLLVGFVLTITLESPFIQLEKIIFQREQTRPAKKRDEDASKNTDNNNCNESSRGNTV